MLENKPNILSMEAQRTGRLCVSSNPSGCLIYVDGIVAIKPNGEAARTPTCINVTEGRRDIVVRSENYDDAIRYADILPNRTTNINVNLKSGASGKVVPFALVVYTLSKLIPLI